MNDASHRCVEVAYALLDRQIVVTVEIGQQATVGDVVRDSGLDEAFPDRDLLSQPTGIWGRVVELDHPVHPGDRVEIYRPLRVEPRERRRHKAKVGLVGRGQGQPDG